MSFLNHPAFQSLVLPLVLTVLGMTALLGLERGVAARRGDRGGAGLGWAPAGALIGLLLPVALMTGLEWPAPARTQKLPWVVLAGVAAALWTAAHPIPGGGGRPAAWGPTAVLWVFAGVWLAGGQVGWLALGLAGLAGALVLALLATAAAGVVAAAVLSVAALGLAGLAAGGGSLLLAQLALILACSTAVPGLWAWQRPASGVRMPPWLLLPLGLTGLCIGWIWLLSAPSQGHGAAAQLALLALAFAVPLLLTRWRWLAHHAHWAPLVAALLAAVPAAAALAWQFGAPAAATPASGDGASDQDDPYYTPRWP